MPTEQLFNPAAHAAAALLFGLTGIIAGWVARQITQREPYEAGYQAGYRHGYVAGLKPYDLDANKTEPPHTTP